MDVVLSQLIAQLNSSVFVLLGILFVAFWALYKLGLMVSKFTMHDHKLDKLESLAEKVIVLATKVDMIYQNTHPNKTVAAHSPISLTKVGEELAAQIKAEELLKRHLDALVAEVETGSPKNAYDIQEASMKVAREKLITCLNDVELNTVKQAAYSKGLLVEDVLSVVGVLLRNHLLTKKGLPVSDVDKHEKKPA